MTLKTANIGFIPVFYVGCMKMEEFYFCFRTFVYNASYCMIKHVGKISFGICYIYIYIYIYIYVKSFNWLNC